ITLNKAPCMVANVTFRPIQPDTFKFPQSPPKEFSGVLSPIALPLADVNSMLVSPLIGFPLPAGALASAVASSVLDAWFIRAVRYVEYGTVYMGEVLCPRPSLIA